MSTRGIKTVEVPEFKGGDFSIYKPFIGEAITRIHYTKHFQTYATNYNNAIKDLATAQEKGEVKKIVALQRAINFNGGGYLNHSLFFAGLAPNKEHAKGLGGEPPASDSALAKKINEEYGSLDKLIAVTTEKLMGLQGSGWAWIVKNPTTGSLDVITTANQDPVPAPYVPVVAIDAWEHAYYLDHENNKKAYFDAVWNVINWQEASRRYDL